MNRSVILHSISRYGLVAWWIVVNGCSVQTSNQDLTDFQFSRDGGNNESGVTPKSDAGAFPDVVVSNRNDAGGEVMVIDAGEDGSCSATGFEAVPIEIEKEVEVPVDVPQPVALYIMLDQSFTMMDSTIGIPYTPPWKWTVAYDAISAFVQDPASKDLDVAIQYFPLGDVQIVGPDAGVSPEVPPECQGTEYLTPDVSMGRLPGNAQAIIDSLNFHVPAGMGTPIEPALRGAIDYCKQYMGASTTGEKCVVVLITDGLPNACTIDFAALAAIAGAGLQNAPNIKTFAIGMTGADFGLLNQIGQQGGTDCTPNDPQTYACDVTSGMTLLEAFELIREYIVETHVEIHKETQYVKMDCQWAIPPPPPLETFDREKVNVEFSPTGLVTDKNYIGKVDSKDNCGSNIGWYYDDVKDPKQIIACPEACTAIKAADLGKIRILLGCQAVVVK
jgi:hypothetical protein